MAKRMLVDATHPEETRVVVMHGNRLEEFDFETASRKQPDRRESYSLRARSQVVMRVNLKRIESGNCTLNQRLQPKLSHMVSQTD